MGPTAANQQPMRVPVRALRRPPRSRLRPRCRLATSKDDGCAGCRHYRLRSKFYEHLPFLFPHADAKAGLTATTVISPPAAPHRAARCRSRYLILALTAVGLDAGPMGGFDAAKVDAEFFPEGQRASNVSINIGYGD